MAQTPGKPFVHLHLHTCYSMLDGACRTGQLIDTAVEYGMPAVALTDHGVMYGAIDFYTKARARGVRPIIGCESYVTVGRRDNRDPADPGSRHHHLVLLADDDEGYHNLMRLASIAQLEGHYYKPRIDREVLAQHRRGLIGLSACLHGEVGEKLAAKDVEGAVKAAGEYAEILGRENFFLEVMDHGIPEQRTVNRLMPEVARRTGLRIVATNDVHYLKKEHARAHEVLLCMQTQTVMSDPKRMRYATDEFYLKSRAEMETLFGDLPGCLDLTCEIAERCNVDIEFGRLHFPVYEVPAGKTQRGYLVELAHDGLSRLYRIPDPAHPADEREREIMRRFESELAVIERTGFINYFLVVWDFVHFAHGRGIPVGPGRGSGGGSIAAYALGITAIDPLRYSLIFERFLNPERVSAPDFDIDFCQARREEVIEYVKDKYGRRNCAQIITFGSLGAKSVIRDVGRVLEIPFAECDRLSKLVPEDPKMTLEKALELNPEFKRAYESEENCRRILDYAFVLEGLYRNPGVHAAGVVIGECDLTEIVPLARDKSGEAVTQYTMEPLGELGLLKMDFLGLKTLTVIQEAVDLVRRHRGVEVDIAGLPMDDKPAYDLLNRGDTVGVFQLESGGMRDLIRRIRIDTIEDLIAMIALYRPGPMNMLPDFVDRKTGKAKIKYDHPLLEPVLKDTYGVMVYQEQVQKAANVLAGYSLGDADVLRRAMGKKKQEEMDRQRATFVAGCKEKNNIDAEQAGRIFDTMAKFAGYGFNKAHSAGYGIVSYQTAYLKANFPEEFMAALLSSEIGNFEKLPVFVSEAIEMGLRILPPDVNASGARFSPEPGAIRYGLAGIKNVGEGAAEAIVAERGRGGPFTGLVDFCSRVDSSQANRKVIESLVRCGACDGFGLHRARLFGGVEFAMNRAAATLRDRQSGQGSLFDLMDEPGPAAGGGEELPDCGPWPENEQLAGEKELLGVYLSGHPLTRYAWLLEHYQLATIEQLKDLPDRTLTRVGGIAAQVTRRITKATKQNMAVVQLEDLQGSVEVLVFPEAYEQYGAQLQQDAAILVCGEVSRREEQPRITAMEIHPLSEAPRLFTQQLRIHAPTAGLVNGRIAELKALMERHPGTTRVVICLLFPGGEKVFVETAGSCSVTPNEELVRDIEHLLGEGSVFLAIDPSPCRRRPAARNGARR